MAFRNSLFALLLASMFLPITASAKTTTWLTEPIEIDGQPEDWYNYPRTHIDDLSLSYSLVNDGEFLYVLVQKQAGMMPGSNRVKLWINADNGKEKNYGFVLQGPDMMPAVGRMGDQQREAMPQRNMSDRQVPRQEAQLDEGLYFLDYETSYPSALTVNDQSVIRMRSVEVRNGVYMYELRLPLVGSSQEGVPPLSLDPGAKFRVGFECMPHVDMGDMGARPGGRPGGGPGGGGGMGGMPPGGGMRGGGRPGGGPPGGMGGGRMANINPKTEWVKFKLAKQE